MTTKKHDEELTTMVPGVDPIPATSNTEHSSVDVQPVEHQESVQSHGESPVANDNPAPQNPANPQDIARSLMERLRKVRRDLPTQVEELERRYHEGLGLVACVLQWVGDDRDRENRIWRELAEAGIERGNSSKLANSLVEYAVGQVRRLSRQTKSMMANAVLEAIHLGLESDDPEEIGRSISSYATEAKKEDGDLYWESGYKVLARKRSERLSGLEGSKTSDGKKAPTRKGSKKSKKASDRSPTQAATASATTEVGVRQSVIDARALPTVTADEIDELIVDLVGDPTVLQVGIFFDGELKLFVPSCPVPQDGLVKVELAALVKQRKEDLVPPSPLQSSAG